jgi:outer membrane protein
MKSRRAAMYRIATAVTCIILFAAIPAFADDLTGRFGITGGAGLFLSHSSDEADVTSRPQQPTNFTGGGGVIYGLNRNFAVTAEGYYVGVGIKNSGDRFDCVDASLGLQYRFRPDRKYVPYIGMGADLLFPTLRSSGENLGGQTTLGGHLKGGIDIFMSRHFAFMVETKALLGPKSPVKVNGVEVDNFDPTSISAVVGYRIIF